jgi:rhodanese-related sulfurtransferase
MNRVIQLAGVALFAVTIGNSVLAGAESPLTIDGAETIDTDTARSLFDQEVAFVDVRKGSDWDAGRVPGAIHLDIKSAYSEDSLVSEVKKDEMVVIYCNGASCMRSSDASKMAVNWGFSNVKYYRDGFPAWKAAGNPVE